VYVENLALVFHVKCLQHFS